MLDKTKHEKILELWSNGEKHRVIAGMFRMSTSSVRYHLRIEGLYKKNQPDRIPDRARIALKMRDRGMSFSEIGGKMRISKQGVHQIISRYFPKNTP